ncbi:MAG: ABC-F family ATP-binding cassette domain-containing protein [Chlamydiota bacterium]
MSLLISVQNISKAFGSQVLFERISLNIVQGDRIGLLGPNGSGKTSLLKILVGEETEDAGEISKRQHLRIGYASQMPEFPDLPIEEVLVKSVKGNEEQHDAITRARIILGKMQFSDLKQQASSLSGGWKKRLDIARALMHEPDLLLLDEPTNHLDLEGILWLEQFLQRENLTYIVVSHDRYFLENISNKIVELNKCYPEGLLVADGSLSSFMEQKEAFLESQAQRQRGLASTVRQEVEWLKRSPKARTTKSQSRIKNTYKLMDELADVKQRNTESKVALNFTASERETRKLLTSNNLTKSLGGKELFKGVDITLSPGSRIGIVGKNGTGKTTLLKLLAGEIQPDLGTIKYADDLKIVYFDQHRNKIDSNVTLKEALSPDSDYVDYHGRQIHVNGWAQKFLFHSDRLGLPVRCLSGGERARILIARLILEPADILFLDEPTNDLDISTLEVIEESLLEFTGAVVLITHDRCMMDRICTKLLGLGEGLERDFFAEYSQWEAACKGKRTSRDPQKVEVKEPLKKKSLSYKEKKELENMEINISQLEEEIEKMHRELNTSSSPDLYQGVANKEKELEALFERWQDLLDRAT